MRHLALFKRSVAVTSGLALVAAAVGIVNPAMYHRVVPVEIAVGVFTQDLVVAFGALLAIGLVVGMRASDLRRAIVVCGILGFFFYAYGIYAIEQVYTPLYVLYLATWAASFYTLALGLAGLDLGALEVRALPAALRVGAAAYGIAIAVMFNVMWIGRLIPLIRTADRIEYLFSVYVIDLVFVMPAFFIASISALRSKPLGIAVLPALFVVGVGILSPLALGEILKDPLYGLPMDAGGLALFGGLAASFLVFATLYLAWLRTRTDVRDGSDARIRRATGGARQERAAGRGGG